MATNLYQDGQTVTWTNTTGAAVSSGSVVVIGTQIGVALTDIADTASGAVAMEGVYALPKATGSAIAQGAAVDYDVSASNINGNLTPATGDLSGCGVAWVAAESADELVMVKINAAGATVS